MSTVKSKDGRVVHLPSEKEERAIQAGIAADPDNPELSDQYFKRAKPARALVGDDLIDSLKAKRPRGRPRGSVSAETKKHVNLRLDPDLLDALRSIGPGWQTQVNETLRKAYLKR